VTHEPAAITADRSVWTDRRILLGIGGGIAAYKLCEVASTLAKNGAQVRAILTASAQQFIAPLSFSTLCRHPAYTDADFWNASQPRPLHIELGEWAEILVLAPLTANSLAKLVHGFADNLLTNTVLASTCPIVLAPAMNTDMWEQEVVQANWRQLLGRSRYHAVGPGSGMLACDRVGAGRLAEPGEILARLESMVRLNPQGSGLAPQGDLRGKRILISSGCTREYIDAVRFISNPSTGKMGSALALAAAHRGAEVTLVHGPMDGRDLPVSSQIQSLAVTSAAEMAEVLYREFASLDRSPDWTFMAAAVSDFGVGPGAIGKLPKSELPDHLALQITPDIAAELGRRKQPHQKLIGFAAQTGADILTPARGKLIRKNLDAIVANSVDQPGLGFGADRNQAFFITANSITATSGDTEAIGPCSKLLLAHGILDRVIQI
jgi:phosphopantothenoylcysteine decarboxylase / phosphopantothenate---cysteine ligase